MFLSSGQSHWVPIPSPWCPTPQIPLEAWILALMGWGKGGPCAVLKQDSTLLCSVLSWKRGNPAGRGCRELVFVPSRKLCFLLQEKTNKTKRLKKGFFFFLWAGEPLRKVELHAWGCLVCLLRERLAVCSQFHRWLSWIRLHLQLHSSPGRAGNQPWPPPG